jgi:hypothetical protein
VIGKKMEYKKKIRTLIRIYRESLTLKQRVSGLMKKRVKEALGYWNGSTEEYYNQAIVITATNDNGYWREYQKRQIYRDYRNEYEVDYREENRLKWNYKSIKSVYKKKYGKNYLPRLWSYCSDRGIEQIYIDDIIKREEDA